MSYQNFKHSIPSGSETAAAYHQLRSFFESQIEAKAYQKVFSTNRIYDIAGNVGASTLAWALSYILMEGLVDQIVRVEVRFGEGIHDYSSIEEVPEILEDWRLAGDEFRVLPEHLQIYYKLHQQ